MSQDIHPAQNQSMIWQPIDTAPRDGSRVLLSCPYYRRAVIGAYNVPAGGWVEATIGELEQPTHWMPLPQTV